MVKIIESKSTEMIKLCEKIQPILINGWSAKIGEDDRVINVYKKINIKNFLIRPYFFIMETIAGTLEISSWYGDFEESDIIKFAEALENITKEEVEVVR